MTQKIHFLTSILHGLTRPFELLGDMLALSIPKNEERYIPDLKDFKCGGCQDDVQKIRKDFLVGMDQPHHSEQNSTQ